MTEAEILKAASVIYARRSIEAMQKDNYASAAKARAASVSPAGLAARRAGQTARRAREKEAKQQQEATNE